MNELQGLKNELTFISDGVKNINERLCKLQNFIEDLSAEPSSSKYPMKLVDLGTWEAESDDHIFLHYAYKTFARLVETCREWNKVDGFVPEWTNSTQIKNVIVCDQVNLSIYSVSLTSCPLYFSTRETAQLFLDTFRTEIESVKELI